MGWQEPVVGEGEHFGTRGFDGAAHVVVELVDVFDFEGDAGGVGAFDELGDLALVAYTKAPWRARDMAT